MNPTDSGSWDSHKSLPTWVECHFWVVKDVETRIERLRQVAFTDNFLLTERSDLRGTKTYSVHPYQFLENGRLFVEPGGYPYSTLGRGMRYLRHAEKKHQQRWARIKYFLNEFSEGEEQQP
jgi:hypothetical protein